MRDASNRLREALYNALNGVLQYNGTPVPVFDIWRPDHIFPSVCILDIGGNQNGSKSQFMYEYSVSLKISSMFIGAVGTSDQVEAISDSILSILCPSPHGPWIDIGPVFKIWSIDFLSGSNSGVELSRQKFIDRNIRLSIKFEQNE